MTKHVDVIVVEGPAGSGKTSFIQQTFMGNDMLEYVRPQITFERPRSYEGRQGAALSTVKDFAPLVEAMLLDPDIETMVLDRFVVSSYIYDALKKGREFNDDRLLFVLQKWGELGSTIAHILLGRGETPYGIRTQWFFMMPEFDQLCRQRDRARQEEGRSFPYSARAEYDMYEKAIQTLGRVPGAQITVVNPHAVDLSEFEDEANKHWTQQ